MKQRLTTDADREALAQVLAGVAPATTHAELVAFREETRATLARHGAVLRAIAARLDIDIDLPGADPHPAPH